MCIIGGCSDNVKMEFQTTMMNLKNNIIEEEEDLLDFPNGPMMVKLPMSSKSLRFGRLIAILQNVNG